MTGGDLKLRDIHDRMFQSFGPQKWWPGDSPWEVCVGAVLTQNTNWGNVEKAIVNLKRARLVPAGSADHGIALRYAEKTAGYPKEELAELIRPSGYFNLKADRLAAVARWWLENAAPIMANMDVNYARKSLLEVKGVGPETADSILLYAFDMPTFVVDAYTKRIMARVRGISENIHYEDLRRLFMDNLEEDSALFNEFHALFVRLAKDFCRKKGCGGAGCPLLQTCRSSVAAGNTKCESAESPPAETAKG